MAENDKQAVSAAEKQIILQNDDYDEINLVELLYMLLGKWKQIAAVTVLCALTAAVVVLFFVTPKYKATATIYVLGRSDSVINMADLQIGSALTSDYIKVFDMWEVHEQVISNLDLPYTYTEMSKMLTVENDSGTRMLDISFTSTSAEEAAAVANEYAEVASKYIAETMKTDEPTNMSLALVPSKPISPQKTKTIFISAVCGMFVSMAVIFAVFMLDDTYKTADDIRKYTGLVTLAAIPKERDEEKHSADRKNKHMSVLGLLKGAKK